MIMDFSVETRDFIRTHLADDVRSLALGRHPEGVDMRAALVQIAGHQAALLKLPEWAAAEDVLWPEHISMEQCTSQQLATFKAGIVDRVLPDGFSMADITGGMGVDCLYLSENAGKVCYNDMNATLCELASHNLPLLGRDNVSVSNLSAEDFLDSRSGEHFGLLYIDPARRSATGGKLVSLKECQPDITALQHRMLDMTDVVMVKMSPMLDISVALSELSCVTELWVLSLAGECKELLAVLRPGFSGDAEIVAVNIAADGKAGPELRSTRAADAERSLPLALAGDVCAGRYLYEPFAAQMKSGLFRTLCGTYGVRQLHADSHLFLSKCLIEEFPGRVFEIESVCQFDKHSARSLFSQYPQANIAVRNFPLSADELRSRFRVRDGGAHYIFGTTVCPQQRVLISAVRH